MSKTEKKIDWTSTRIIDGKSMIIKCYEAEDGANPLKEIAFTGSEKETDELEKYLIEKYFQRKTFGQWNVEFDEIGGLTCNDNDYFIAGESLEETDWINHMEKKTWINMGDFMLAYDYALKLKNQ